MQKITSYMAKVVNSSFVKNLSITFMENIVTKVLGFLIILILVRNLGPDNYGIYSFIFINILMFSQLFDFGMENTAIRFSNRDKEKQNSIFGLYFLIKLSIISLVIFTLVLFGQTLLIKMHKPELIKFIPVFIIGFLGESIFFVNDTYLQCVQKFKLRAFINITRYLTVVAFATTMYLFKLISLKYITFIFIIPLFFVLFFIPRYYLFIKEFLTNKLSKNLVLELFHYEKWMLVLSIGNSLMGRIDIYMLSIWVSYTQIGIYSAAFNLLSIISFLPAVLGKVMLPKMAETKIEKLFDLTLSITKPILGLSFLLLFIIPLFPYIVPLLFGHKYDDSILIVQILSISTLIGFSILPIEQSMYPLGKPKVIVLFRYIQLAVNILINIYTIPKFGIVAAASSALVTRLLSSLLLFIYFMKQKSVYTSKD
ncbi:MAG: oligosaccharide flippase family protein [bacterium]